MGFPKTKLLMTSTLLACTSTGQPPNTPRNFMLSEITGRPAEEQCRIPGKGDLPTVMRDLL